MLILILTRSVYKNSNNMFTLNFGNARERVLFTSLITAPNSGFNIHTKIILNSIMNDFCTRIKGEL